MLAKTGPARNLNIRSLVAGSSWITSVPVMSMGIRSGVNWMRLKLKANACARVLTIKVFARPGTPTNRAWPRQKMAIKS